MPQAGGVADVMRIPFRNYTYARARAELTDVALRGHQSPYARGEIFANFWTAIDFCEWRVRRPRRTATDLRFG